MFALSARIPYKGRCFFPACELSLYLGVFEKVSEWFAPSLMIQYYNGYGYTLIEHERRIQAWRMGLATVR